MDNKPIVFFGAGKFAGENIDSWLSDGLIPVCFSDNNPEKHGKGFHGYEVLPIDDVLNRYPYAYFFITASPAYCREVYMSLLSFGIPMENIAYLDKKHDAPLYCEYVGNVFVFENDTDDMTVKISSCCLPQRIRIKCCGSFEDDIKTYEKSLGSLFRQLRTGNPASCYGCIKLKQGSLLQEPSIKKIGFSTGLQGTEFCNLNCIYCCHENTIKHPGTNSYNLKEIFFKLAEIFEGKDLFIGYTAGEIAVSPYRFEILNLWKLKKWHGRIATNASVYLDDIALLMRSGLVRINVSLDSGTKETFAKVKGKDCFGKAVENIMKYSKNGGGDNIDLKYIILENYNCDTVNVDGFLNICKATECSKAIISHNFEDNLRTLSKSEYDALAYCTQKAKELNVKLEVMYEDFNNLDWERINALGCKAWEDTDTFDRLF